MYKLYLRDTNKKRINEEPLIIETIPLYGTTFCLSLKDDAVTMRVKDTIKIIGLNDLTNGYSYYLDVSPCQNSLSSVRDFTVEEIELIKRDIVELNKTKKPSKLI